MVNELSDIKCGLLEVILGTEEANKMREEIPLLTPRCTWGLKVDRCGKKATVKHRLTSDSDWNYQCDRHGFHPNYLDILGKLRRNSESEWEWLDGSDRDPPEYSVPESLKSEEDI